MLMSDLCVHVFPSALTTSHDVAMLLWGATCFFLCLFFFFSFPLCHLFPTSYGIFFNSEFFFFSLLSVPFFFYVPLLHSPAMLVSLRLFS